MKDLAGKPVLAWVVEAAQRAQNVDQVIVATSNLTPDDLIVRWCEKNRVEVFRGSEHDVLDRFYQCAKKHKGDVLIRLTADCPFLDYNVISDVVRLRKVSNADYAQTLILLLILTVLMSSVSLFVLLRLLGRRQPALLTEIASLNILLGIVTVFLLSILLVRFPT
jgi:spore coat polysaccharide biosynthesis protein SpsF (cytidylyltransferase family)